MTRELLLAYEKTRYQVLTEAGDVVAEAVVGQSSAQVDRVLAEHGATSGVFITAWNPRSEIADPAANRQAGARLHDELVDAGMLLLPHRGVGADPAWEPEEGFLAVGMTAAQAVPVAVAYGQNAVVVTERGGVAQLLVTEVMDGTARP